MLLKLYNFFARMRYGFGVYISAVLIWVVLMLLRHPRKRFVFMRTWIAGCIVDQTNGDVLFDGLRFAVRGNTMTNHQHRLLKRFERLTYHQKDLVLIRSKHITDYGEMRKVLDEFDVK